MVNLKYHFAIWDLKKCYNVSFNLFKVKKRTARAHKTCETRIYALQNLRAYARGLHKRLIRR